MSHDVIVIGSGIGGLTAALTCAKRGRSVLVLEAAKQFGGFINPFARKGYWFDTGIHYIGEMGPGQSLHRQFERLGLLDKVQFRELDPNGFDRYAFPDYEVAMCKGADAYCARLTRDFPHEASGLKRFFSMLDDIQTVLKLVSKGPKPGQLLRALPKLPTLLRYHKATFSEIVNGCITDPRLRAVLAGPGGDIGLPPGKASGLVMMAVIGHFLGGAYFPIGGTKAVRDAYVACLQEQGAELRRNSPVERILVENGRAVGVRTRKGEELRADVVISNAPAVPTLQKLVGMETLPGRLRRKVSRAEYSLGSLCAFVGTDLQPQDHGVTEANVWHYPSYDIDALYAPALEGRIGHDLPFFLTVPTLKDPSNTHAPAGKHTVELITFAPYNQFEPWVGQKSMKREQAYNELKQQLGDRLIERAERYIPGLRDHMVVHEIATPATNVSYVNTPAGSIYGLSHTPGQIGLGRFGTRTPVQGLFLCGADVLGGGIATCATSGTMAARAAMARPSRLQRLRQRRGTRRQLAAQS